jgi:hypothetical protein
MSDAWLNLKTAEEMSDRPLSEMDSAVPNDACRASTWAHSAGASDGMATTKIEEFLRSSDAFAKKACKPVNCMNFPAPVDPAGRRYGVTRYSLELNRLHTAEWRDDLAVGVLTLTTRQNEVGKGSLPRVKRYMHVKSGPPLENPN